MCEVDWDYEIGEAVKEFNENFKCRDYDFEEYRSMVHAIICERLFEKASTSPE